MPTSSPTFDAQGRHRVGLDAPPAHPSLASQPCRCEAGRFCPRHDEDPEALLPPGYVPTTHNTLAELASREA